MEGLQIGHFAKEFGKVRRGSSYESRPAPSAEQRSVHSSGVINLAESRKATGDAGGARVLLENLIFGSAGSALEDTAELLMAKHSLAALRHANGEVASARQIYEEILPHIVLQFGIEHPLTSSLAADLLLALAALGEYEAGAAIIRDNLAWMRERDPSTLDPQQRRIQSSLNRLIFHRKSEDGDSADSRLDLE